MEIKEKTFTLGAENAAQELVKEDSVFIFNPLKCR